MIRPWVQFTRSVRWPLVSAVILATMMVIVVVNPVSAGPVTAPGSPPFVKLGVYQGVIAIVPPSGTNVLEIGNAGRDIAGSSDIYLRPGGVTTANAVKLARSVTYTQAAVTIPGGGQVCLDQTQAGGWSCQPTWPTGGPGGDTLWTLTGSVLSPVILPSPNDIDTIQIGSQDLLRECRGGTVGTNQTVCSNDTICISSYGPLSYCEIVGDKAVNGSALVLNANLASPALQGTNQFITGYDQNPTDPIFSGIYTGGDVRITGGRLVANYYSGIALYDSTNFTGGWGVEPWSQTNVFYDPTRSSSFNSAGSGIDADTFGGTVTLAPLQSDKNIYWKIPTQYRFSACDGGTNHGATCAVKDDCPNFNAPCSARYVCIGGANNGQVCSPGGVVNAADCGAGVYCDLPRACSGGVNDGRPCRTATSDTDCGTGISCVRTDGKVCREGDRKNQSCTVDNDCPGTTTVGRCNYPLRCTGYCELSDGTRTTNSCTSDNDCPTLRCFNNGLACTAANAATVCGNSTYCRPGHCNTTSGNPSYGRLCTASADCAVNIGICRDHPWPVMCISVQTSTGKICTLGSEIGKPCSADTDCAGSSTAGRCAQMCGGVQTVCPSSATGLTYSSPPTIAVPNLTCANYHRRYTNFCVGGTAPTGASSVVCLSNEQCVNSYGPLSNCRAPTCEDKCRTPTGYWCYGNINQACSSGADTSCPGGFGYCVPNNPGCVGQPRETCFGENAQNGLWNRYCTSDAQCDASSVGGPSFRCGMTLCEGHGTCRLLASSSKPGGSYGWCFNDVTCTKNDDCAVRNSTGAIVEKGACQSMGFCSYGAVKSTRTCGNGNECYNSEICALGEPNPYYGGNDSYWCKIACQGMKIDRCRGATTVTGAPINSCSDHGNDPTYTDGKSRLINGSFTLDPNYICDCTTVQQVYALASTQNADICTKPFR